MFDRKRPIWRSVILHLALFGGSLVFALPYAWLVGTSWKLDKEIQSKDIRILPDKPIAPRSSPWIDPQQFAPIERPEHVSAERWEWIEPIVRDGIHRFISKTDGGIEIASHPEINPRLDMVSYDPTAAVSEVEQGVFRRLVNLVPYNLWQSGSQAEFIAAVDKALTPDLVQDCFNQCFRYFALGSIRLITNDYRVVNLTGEADGGPLWQVVRGPATIESRKEGGRSITAVSYAFQGADSFRLASTHATGVDLPDQRTGFKRIELSYRGDLSWHDLRVYVEMNGRTWRTEEPKYLATDQWSEVHVQLPSQDDQRLMPRRYIRLADVGPSDVNEPGVVKVSVELQRSTTPEAYWAKGTENYRTAFDEVPFWRYFRTSTFLVLANVIGTLLSCSLVGYAFARLSWPGRDLCFVLVLATLMIPPQITMIPSFVIYKHLGWYNTLAPLWVPNWLAVNGFGIFLLRQAMKGIPKDLEEAAKIDGCSHLRIWWHIMLPLVRPTLAAISIFTFMFVWNDFMGPLIYVNDQRLYPLALGLFSFMAGRENQFTLIMAGSMIMTLPVIIIFFFAQRYFIQGVSMTGMKT